MKTIDEAAKFHARDMSSNLKSQKMCIYDFKKGVEFAQRFIPIEEKLPEERVPVIVMLDYKFYGTDIQATDVCRLVGDDWFNCLRPQHSNGGVTHWRPIELK